MPKIRALWLSLRPGSWIKNGFLFAPLIFGGKLYLTGSFFRETLAFLAFCCCASGLYLINDLIDRNLDKLHPVKSRRPIASGLISGRAAATAGISLFIISLVVSFMVNPRLAGFTAVYCLFGLAYSFYFKKKVIMDIMSIAFGFELRIWAGSAAIGIVPSVWLQMATFILALFLGFAKRRQEIAVLGSLAPEHRRVLENYPRAFLDQLIGIFAGLSILAYSLYTVSAEVIARTGKESLIYTLPFVIYGVLRYLFLIWTEQDKGDLVRTLLQDTPLLASVLIWIISVIAVLYVF